MKIAINLCYPDDRSKVISLSWDILESKPAFVWSNLLIANLNNAAVDLFSRFSGLLNHEKNSYFLAASLNSCIKIINRDRKYRIEERCVENYTQENLNAIHHHFEILTDKSMSQFLIDASPEVRKAVRGINYYIHDLEVLTRNIKMKELHKNLNAFALIMEFRKCEKYLIPEEFNTFFSTDVKFGDMVLHYAQVGKTWSEAFWDKDDVIFDEAIRPLEYISGEFDVMFSYHSFIGEEKANFEEFLKNKGLLPEDPTLRLGHLKVAQFNDDLKLDGLEYEKIISAYSDIASIKIFNDMDVLAERVYTHSTKLF